MAININHQTNELVIQTDGRLLFDEHVTSPATPSTGNVVVYAKQDGFMYSKDDLGTETQLGGGGSTPYDIGGLIDGVPAGSAIVLNHVAVRTFLFADNFAGSFATSQTAATASTVFTVKRNGSSIGTITFGAASTTGTFNTTGGAESFTPGQVLTVHAPALADATLADISITFFGTV